MARKTPYRMMLLCLLALLARPVEAQLGLTTAQNPPELRWMELSSEHFRLVFPEELRPDALYTANLLEYLREGLSEGFEAPMRRTTVVLSNQQGRANGYVGYFPRRSEWFHVAPTESLLGTIEWFSLLAVHEGRHLAQLSEMRRGSVVAAHVLLGELGEAALIFGLGAPAWFIEGDATLVETLATESGRGRHPGFQRPLRASALERDLPSYSQALFGSYRRGFLSPYELGYHLTARIRRDYGPEAAGEILRGAGRWAVIPGAFERNLKRVTGMSAAELYRTTLEELEGLWRAQAGGLPVTPARPLLADPEAAVRDGAEYRFPAGVDGGTVAVKASLSQAPAVVLVDPAGRERALRAALPLGGLAARGDRVVWAQHYPHPRWGNRSTTDLVEHGISTGRTRRLTHGRVLQSPALSADAARVAAVEVLPDRSVRIVVFRDDGGESEEYRAAAGAHLQEPAWSPDGTRLYFFRTEAAGKALLELTVGAGAVRELLPPGREMLQGLDTWGDTLLFGSDYSGQMSVYALEPSSGTILSVAARPYGIAGFAVQGDELILSEGSPNGLLLSALPLRPQEWAPREESPVRRVDVFQPIVERENRVPLLDPRRIPRREYEIRPYRPGPEEILPYAWLPAVAADADGPQSAGLTLFSASVLRDRAWTLSAGWDLRHGGPEGAFSLETGRRFPQLFLGASYDLREFPGSGERAQALMGSLGVRLPLTLDGISLRQGLSVEARYAGGPVWARGRDPLAVRTVGAAAGWHLTTRPSRRDLAPRWGLLLDTAGRVELPNAAVDRFEAGGSATVTALLPGLFRHHGLRLSSTAARDGTGALHPVPRGYEGNPFESDTVIGASAGYRLPLAYPDLGLGSWFHLPRLVTGAFTDLAFEPGDPAGSLRATLGLELLAEINILVPLPLQVGAQLVYRFEDGRFAFRETLLGFTVVLE